MVISIDIGTSYSSVCVLDKEGKVEPVEVSTGISIYGGKYSLPSAVFVDNDGTVLVGQAAMNSRKKMPQNFRSEFKRDIGQNIPVVLGNRSFLPEDFYTEIFLHMKKCVEKRGMVDKAYITYPASFGKARREKIAQAARKAGLFDVELIDEPTAVAMCYGTKGTLKDGDILLVYDFGGGTFDAAVIKYKDGQYESIVPAEGLAHCGGIDIDRTIYNDMRSKIPSGLLKPLEGNKMNRLRFEGQLAELAVKVKHHLSTAENAYEDIAVGFDVLEYHLERGTLEKMAVSLVSQSIGCCRSILENAGLTVDTINGILLAGGTSRMPLVQDMVRELAGNVPVYMDADLDLSVVQGALQLAGDGNVDKSDRKNENEEKVRRNNRKWNDKDVCQVMFLGTYSVGKSTLLNALVKSEILPTGIVPTTFVITKLIFNADDERVVIFERDKRDDKGQPVPVMLESSEKFFKEYLSQNSWNFDDFDYFFNLLEHVVIYRKENGIAGSRVQLIDSPGLIVDSNDHYISHYATTADALVFVISATMPLSTREREYINRNFSNRHMENVFFVVTKVDFLDEEGIDDLKYCIRSGLQNVFTDEDGWFDEELYHSRVFYVNAFGAINTRLNRKTPIMSGHEIMIPEDKTGVPEFEKHLYDYIGCST